MANVLELYNRFKGGGSGGKMVYPLENQADYLGKMTFTPIIEKPINITTETGNLVEMAKEGIQFIGDAITAAIAAPNDEPVNIYGEKGRSGPGPLALATLANQTDAFNGAGKVGASTAFSRDGLDLNTDKRISLYLPRAIQIQDTVTYDNAFQLGLIGGAIERGGAGAALGAIASEASGAVNTLLGRTGGMSSDAAGIIAGKVASRLSDTAGGAVRSRTRLTTNPNTRALFKDVPIRNFSFAFQLIPTSRAEARVIEEIIKTFRTELYPEALTAGGVNVGYRFPNRFLIKVKYNNTEIKGIRFLPVYMQSFNATYNSATGGMHNDGRFSAVDISMAFTETRAIAKADIEGGY
jgi:hypothetical protein